MAPGGSTAESGASRATRRLIINADDFGFSDGVSRGIMEAHIAGGVTSASMMVNTPGFDAAARLAARTPSLDLGLHLNLTVGPPVAPADRVSSLLDLERGEFVSLGVLVRRALGGQLRPEHVAAECAAQLDRLRSAGITPSHIDSHRHVHALPGVLTAVASAAIEAGVRIVRAPLEPLAINSFQLPALVTKALILGAWLSGEHARAIDGRFIRVDHFRGISLQGISDFAAGLRKTIEALPAGTTELMVHPGHADPELRALDGYADARERELEVLLSGELPRVARDAGVSLISFAEL